MFSKQPIVAQNQGLGVSNRPDTPNPFHVLALIVGMAILLAFVGCKAIPTPMPTPMPTHTHDSVRTEYIHDSIYTDRWHTIYAKGDTIYVHDSIYFAQWKHDSIYIDNSRTDTIYQPVPVEVIKEVDRSPFLHNSGIAFWVLVAFLVLSVIIGVVLRFAK